MTRRGDRRLRGATDYQKRRALDALFDLRQTHLGGLGWGEDR